ncbi:MAG TPA: glycine cleavage system protein GcvH [Actinomycetota bacterium]|jgi:glycine cleavage system H protein|nr:glycine cleavage system protein GcvH [Actinomycetota bacterium]HNL50379.1 glycine cleavage system protein GcvH [Actinomycetota bacterium]HNO14520.1 glycine cleavage system protein GcvH [Actinomycetota bacterium]HUM85734.1 glycine cleavage system protein GcvH [Actinomycetota bacterium]
MTPDDRRFTREHEWVISMDNGNLRVGITDFAQDALGDVVFVALPEVGVSVSAGDAVGEVESTKSVSEIYAPVAGTVVARNDAVETAPETVNADPYEGGWLFVLQPEDPEAAEDLLSAEDYDALVQEI